MKKFVTSSLLLFSLQIFPQVIIGDNIGTTGNKTSVLLEFANNNNKGIIVPYVRTLPSSPVEGTIILDATTSTAARIKYYNGGWVDLSGQDGDVTTNLENQPTGISETNGKAIIGATTSNADGVLVLESTTQAMVLPIVSDVNNIPSPSPGMMVYINGTNKRLVPNGVFGNPNFF